MSLGIDFLTFETYLLKNGKHKNTVEKHLKNLAAIGKRINSFSEIDLFLAGLKKQNRSHACINAYIDTIRLLITCFELPYEKPKHVKKLTISVKETLTTEEIRALIDLPCPARCEKYQFQKFSLFLRVLAETGCRPGELAKTTKDSFRPDRLILNETKTGNPRSVPISEDLYSEARRMPVEEFIISSGSYLGNGGNNSSQVIVESNRGYIFTTSTKRLYSDHSWDHAFKKRLRILGINRPGITIYSLRHSFATECRRQKMELDMLSQIMGSSVEMIAKTYSHLDLRDLKIALSRHPLMRNSSDPMDLLQAFQETLRTFGFLTDKRFKCTFTDSGNSFSAIVGLTESD